MTDNQSVDSMDGEKLEFRTALPLFLVVMIDAFSMTVILPLLPYYGTAFGMNIVGLGALLATSPVFEILSSWRVYSTLSKKFGRRPVLIISQLGTFLGFVLLGVANAVWILFLARIVDGIAGANNTIGRKLVRDTLTPNTRTHGLGLIDAAYSLGFLAGPAVGLLTLALTNDDYRMIPFVGAGISLFAVILSIFLSHETLPPESRKSSGLGYWKKLVAKITPLRKPHLLFLFAILFLVQFSYIGFIEFFGLLALNRLGMNAISTAVMWLLGALLVIIVDGSIVGRLSRRYDDRRLIPVGLGLLAAGLIIAAMIPKVPVVWYSRSEILEELSLGASALGELSISPKMLIDLPSEGATGWLGFGWFLIALFLITVSGSMLIPMLKSILMGNVEGFGPSGVLIVSSILYKSAFIIVPLVLGFAIWRYGFTAAFLVEGLILLIFLVFTLRLMKSGTVI